MVTNMPKIVCAISGVTLNDEDEAVLEALDITDGATELPVGWTRITAETRSLNPSFEAIQYVKASLIAQMLTQMPPELREDAEEAVSIQYDAQFAALEAHPANVPTLLTKVSVYIAPVDRVPGLDKEVEKLFASLGVDLGQDDDDDDSDEDDGPAEGEEDDDQSEKDQEQPTPPRRRRRRTGKGG